MARKNPKVDAYLSKSDAWQKELKKLRTILLACGLTEDFKWAKPCYTLDNGNVAATARLKDHCWLMFFKGALLRDPSGLLTKAGENSRVMRVIPFTSVRQITAQAIAVKALVVQAIEAERAGLKVDLPKAADLVFPAELTTLFKQRPDVKAAFDALTPGRQREYNLHFSGAKQSATRASRIEKCIPRILDGKGRRDR